LLFAACIAPWIVRNGLRANYRGFSSVFGDTLFSFAAPEVIARAEHITDDQARQRVGKPSEYQPRTVFLNAYARPDSNEYGPYARKRQNRALEIIAAHPWTYAQLHAKGCLAFWLPGTDALEIAGLTKGNRGTLEVLHKEGLWAAAKHYFGDSGWAIALAVPIALFTLVQYLAGLLCIGRGLLARARMVCSPDESGQHTLHPAPDHPPRAAKQETGKRERIPAEVWLLALIVLVSCLVSGTTGTPRFRVPVEPILNVAAAAGLVGLLAGRRKTEGMEGLSAVVAARRS
jgi:hypothetical protein